MAGERIDVSLSASGLSVQTQSLLSILIGGVAFQSPATDGVLPAAAADTVFVLYSDRAKAFEPAARSPQTYKLIFKESVRGLAPGAPVEFRGIPIGEVADIQAQIDLKTFEFSVPVTIRLDPQRLGVRVIEGTSGADLERMRRRLIDALIADGARAQLRTGNLLTGSVFVAIDFFPGAPPAMLDWSQIPVQLPTVPGQLQVIETKVTDLINKLDKMPLQQIGDELTATIAELDQTLVAARGTLVSARGTLNNTTSLTGPNSAQIEQLGNTLQEVSRASRSVRVLADYLERHPEALLRGKKGEAK
ncbi:MAG: MlaD family protein [Candidatus Binataceae bacterium]